MDQGKNGRRKMDVTGEPTVIYILEFGLLLY
jgi:hypothetical protein